MPKTGATRYQKFLKSEKAKTKLKAKKELPKGTNVTKTNFKIKKIIIKEQLKKHSDTEPLSTRKLNVKELLTRLNHFNVHSRTDALDGLKELITTHSDVIELHLGQLVHGVTPLVLNMEKVIRRETLKVLHLMLSNTSLEKIEPFFDVMSTYLRSAMTHIDSRIQEDSLLFLDILLLCTPERTAKDFHKIIPNFLDMISKLRVDSKPGRTLTVNLDSQITSAKWRVKVLNRLKEFLQKFIKCNQINVTEKKTIENTFKFDETKFNYFPLFNPSYTSVCYLSCFSSKNAQEDQGPQDDMEKFKLYTETLMPLLFETWLESRPNASKENNMEIVVNEDAAALLKNTLEVISLIWEIVVHYNKENPSSELSKIFSQKYRQPFCQHIFQSFPYVTNIRGKSKGQLSGVFENAITDPKLTVENLKICNLYIAFNPNVNVKSQQKEITSLLNYIERIFNQNTEDNVNDAVIEILQSIFSNKITTWTKDISVMDSLSRKIIWAYFNQELSSKFRQKIFALLCQISLNDRLAHFHKSEAFEKWLTNLPDILLGETITVQTIDILHKFAVCNNKTFNSLVKPKLIDIIKNLPKIKVSDPINETSIHKLLSLLYWIKCWDNESLNLLESQLLNSCYRSDHGKYIFDTLKIKSGGTC